MTSISAWKANKAALFSGTISIVQCMLKHSGMSQHSPVLGECVSWPQPSPVHHCSSASDLAAAATAAHSDPAAWQLLLQLLWRLHR